MEWIVFLVGFIIGFGFGVLFSAPEKKEELSIMERQARMKLEDDKVYREMYKSIYGKYPRGG